jgi:hypothetical protein
VILSVEEEKLLLRLRQLKSVAVVVLVDLEGKPIVLNVMSPTEELGKKTKRER